MAGRLDAWARRKARVREEEAAEAAARETAQRREAQAALDAKPDAEVLAELDLPDPDTLAPGDDFAAFLRAEVPERLRRRALRRLWRSNPVLACVDGLNDYDDDFTTPATSGAAMKTLYRVGRGLLREAEPAAAAAPPAETAAAAPEAPAPAKDAASAQPPVEDVPQGEPPAEPRPRMRFAFHDAPESGGPAA